MRCWLAASTSPASRSRGRGDDGQAVRVDQLPRGDGLPLDLAVGLRAGEGAHVGERRYARPRPVELGQLRGGRGHERAAQHQHAAARGRWSDQTCGGRAGHDRRKRRCAARDHLGVGFCETEAARDHLEVGDGLGIRHHDRGTAACRRRPDTRRHRLRTVGCTHLCERDLDRVSRGQLAARAIVRPLRQARVGVGEVRVGGVLRPVERHPLAVALQQMNAADGDAAGGRERRHQQQRHARRTGADHVAHRAVLLPHVAAQGAVATQQQARVSQTPPARRRRPTPSAHRPRRPCAPGRS